MFGYFLKYWLRFVFYGWDKLTTIISELDRWIRTTTPLARVVLSFPVFILTFLAITGFLTLILPGLYPVYLGSVAAVITVIVMHLRANLLDKPTPKHAQQSPSQTAADNAASDRIQKEEYNTDVYDYNPNENKTDN